MKLPPVLHPLRFAPIFPVLFCAPIQPAVVVQICCSNTPLVLHLVVNQPLMPPGAETRSPRIAVDDGRGADIKPVCESRFVAWGAALHLFRGYECWRGRVYYQGE